MPESISKTKLKKDNSNSFPKNERCDMAPTTQTAKAFR